MPFDFDLEAQPPTVPGILPQQQEEQDQDAAVDEFLGEEAELDSQLSEVEKRLEKAQYYRALLTQEIFEGDYSAPAQAIMEEIRVFIRSRLGVLLGVTSEATPAIKVKPLFEDDEVKILKQVAAKILKKPSIMEPAPQPTLKKVESPHQPQVSAMKPKGPQVRKAQAPPGRPQQGQALSNKKPETSRKPPAKATPTEEVITIEQTMRDGSKTSTKYRKFIDPKLGDIYIDYEGKRYRLATNELGEKFMQSITTQARPHGAKPFPPLTGAQLSMVSQQQAAEVVSKMDKGMASLVQTAVQTPAKE